MSSEGSAASLGIENHSRAKLGLGNFWFDGPLQNVEGRWRGSTTAHLERAAGERSPATSPGGAAETVINNLRHFGDDLTGFVHPEHGRIGSLQPIGVHTAGSPLSDMYGSRGHPIAKDSSGRAYVVVAHTQPDGTVVSLPFWNSSGGGGKGDEFAGNWYHYPGHSSNGWAGKFDGLLSSWNNHYNSPVLKFYADQLNRHVGNVSAPTGKNYNAEAAKHIGVFSPQEDRDFQMDVNDATIASTPLFGEGASRWAIHDWLDALSPGSKDEGWMEALNRFGRHGHWLRDGLQFPVAKSMRKSWFNHAIWPGGK